MNKALTARHELALKVIEVKSQASHVARLTLSPHVARAAKVLVEACAAYLAAHENSEGK